MTVEREQIQAFLHERKLVTASAPAIRKAGLVAFMREPLCYYVMTPVANKPDLGLPEFQICKGTRMYKSDDGWADMRGVVPDGALMETLPETALREGIEELGLKLSNIAALQALGEYSFTSATNRKEVALWLLAAEMQNEADFLPPHAIAASTAERRWMTLAEFRKAGRPDHAHILGLAEERIQFISSSPACGGGNEA